MRCVSASASAHSSMRAVWLEPGRRPMRSASSWKASPLSRVIVALKIVVATLSAISPASVAPTPCGVSSVHAIRRVRASVSAVMPSAPAAVTTARRAGSSVASPSAWSIAATIGSRIVSPSEDLVSAWSAIMSSVVMPPAAVASSRRSTMRPMR